VQRTIASTITNSTYQFLGYKKKLMELSLGQKKLVNITAYSLPRTAQMDTDGLIPTSAFHSIFISHSQRFVIFEPSLRRSPPPGQAIADLENSTCPASDATPARNTIKAADDRSGTP
jgi:hypothetical protein